LNKRGKPQKKIKKREADKARAVRQEAERLASVRNQLLSQASNTIAASTAVDTPIINSSEISIPDSTEKKKPVYTKLKKINLKKN